MASIRSQTVRTIHQQYAPVYSIGAGLTLILIGVWIGSLLFRTGYFTNVYTEALSVIATIAVLDRLSDWREERRLKLRLQREATSRDNSTALNAVDWLRAENWLTLDDGEKLLQGQKLARANLEDAYLYQGDLDGCNLYRANFKNADISQASLCDAFLNRANLAGVSAYGTDFRGAVLWDANLRNMRHIQTAIFDETTVLPDARPFRDEQGNILYDEQNRVLFNYYWTPGTDMTRFTNPDHQDFWYVDE